MTHDGRDPEAIVAGRFLILLGAGTLFLGGSCSTWWLGELRHPSELHDLAPLALVVSFAFVLGGALCIRAGWRLVRGGWGDRGE